MEQTSPPTESRILGVFGRQLAWLNLEAPRHQLITRLPASSNALELTAQSDSTHVVAAVGAAFAGSGAHGADLVYVDLASGDISPLVERADPRESLDSRLPDRHSPWRAASLAKADEPLIIEILIERECIS